jgi:hypothetical protein
MIVVVVVVVVIFDRFSRKREGGNCDFVCALQLECWRWLSL